MHVVNQQVILVVDWFQTYGVHNEAINNYKLGLITKKFN